MTPALREVDLTVHTEHCPRSLNESRTVNIMTQTGADTVFNFSAEDYGLLTKTVPMALCLALTCKTQRLSRSANAPGHLKIKKKFVFNPVDTKNII